jgi:hypothetical protein
MIHKIYIFTLTSILAICCFAANASASEHPHSFIAMHLMRPDTAAADLDGDHIPDLASGIRTGHTPEGYSYRVDLDLSSNPEARTFSVFSAEPGGLTIEAIDIDGDHDLDLIVRDRFSLRPVGIWLNDGTGRFTPGDLKAYVLSGAEAERYFESRGESPRPVVHLEFRRPQLILIRANTHPGTLSALFRELRSLLRGPFHITFDAVRLRAPPFLNV